MIGRDAELAVLAGALAAAEAGSGTLLVLEGPAGIGKTTLLDAAATDARRRGLAVLRARGNPLERDFPFGIARQLFAPLQSATTWPGLCRGPAALADRVLGAATPAPANSADATAAAAHGLFCLTANQAAAERTVLCVDDLHWADLPSLRWLAGVARRVEDLGVAVVATVRSGDPSVSPGALDELLTGATVRLGHRVTGDGRALVRSFLRGDEGRATATGVARAATRLLTHGGFSPSGAAPRASWQRTLEAVVSPARPRGLTVGNRLARAATGPLRAALWTGLGDDPTRLPRRLRTRLILVLSGCAAVVFVLGALAGAAVALYHSGDQVIRWTAFGLVLAVIIGFLTAAWRTLAAPDPAQPPEPSPAAAAP